MSDAAGGEGSSTTGGSSGLSLATGNSPTSGWGGGCVWSSIVGEGRESGTEDSGSGGAAATTGVAVGSESSGGDGVDCSSSSGGESGVSGVSGVGGVS